MEMEKRMLEVMAENKTNVDCIKLCRTKIAELEKEKCELQLKLKLMEQKQENLVSEIHKLNGTYY